MSRIQHLFVTLFIVGLAAVNSSATAQTRGVPKTIVLDGRALAVVKARAYQHDPVLIAAFESLKRIADAQLVTGPFSVTDNPVVPPSGDKRDYMSQARYFWPDPTKPNGLPYIRKDGETNPESRNGDEEPLGDMVRGVRYLSLAFYYSNDERYASRAAFLLRTWFLDPQKHMTPRLAYGQSIPGVTEGSALGILETRSLLEVVDAIALLDSSRSLTAADRLGIKKWFQEYVAWLKESPFGKEESTNPANHGTWYDAQLAGFSLFVGDTATARRVLNDSISSRYSSPIEPDGRQPHELERADAFGYSIFNLEALTTLASVGRTLEIDAWNHRSEDGRGMRAAADYLVPFIQGRQTWTHGKKPATGHNDQLVELYRRMANLYNDAGYEAIAVGLPEAVNTAHVVDLTLLYPRFSTPQVAVAKKPIPPATTTRGSGGSTTSPRPTATPSSTAAAPPVSIPIADPAKIAAIEVIKFGGTVSLMVEGKGPVSIKSTDPLPTEKFAVVEIDLTKCSAVSDTTLQLFAPLSRLERLILDGTSVGDQGLAHLAELTELRDLFLDDTRSITDSGMQALAGLAKLTELRLKRQQITDAGLKHLNRLTALSKLRIAYNTGITDTGLAELSKLPALEFVNAIGTGITTAGVTNAQKDKPGLKVTLK